MSDRFFLTVHPNQARDLRERGVEDVVETTPLRDDYLAFLHAVRDAAERETQLPIGIQPDRISARIEREITRPLVGSIWNRLKDEGYLA